MNRALPVRALLVALALSFLALSAAPAAGAQSAADASPDPQWVRETHQRLSRELMSPFCKGLTLENCPSSGAAEMRDQILAWLQEGRSESWVLDTLVAEWGEEILGAPRFRGLGILVWVAPAVLLAMSGAWMVIWLRRHARVASVPSAPVPATGSRDEALRRRVDAEIESLLE